jgi:hypothetical protein
MPDGCLVVATGALAGLLGLLLIGTTSGHGEGLGCLWITTVFLGPIPVLALMNRLSSPFSRLTLTAQHLTVERRRGTTQLPLEDIVSVELARSLSQRLEVRTQDAAIRLGSGRSTLELTYLRDLIADSAQRRRAALTREGADLRKPARPPATLAKLLDR